MRASLWVWAALAGYAIGLLATTLGRSGLFLDWGRGCGLTLGLLSSSPEVLLNLVLFVPFFCAGCGVSWAIQTLAATIHRAYAFDLRDRDYLISTYRSHGHTLARGSDPNRVMAELFGKAAGCTGGKGGSMHLFDASLGFLGGHGIVGAQVPLGAGIAFAEKYNKTGNLCICYMGDGAVRQGALHETFNLAMLWKLPVIFIIENNNYAMGTSVERTSNVHDLWKLGLAYDMPSKAVSFPLA